MENFVSIEQANIFTPPKGLSVKHTRSFQKTFGTPLSLTPSADIFQSNPYSERDKRQLSMNAFLIITLLQNRIKITGY